MVGSTSAHARALAGKFDIARLSQCCQKFPLGFDSGGLDTLSANFLGAAELSSVNVVSLNGRLKPGS